MKETSLKTILHREYQPSELLVERTIHRLREHRAVNFFLPAHLIFLGSAAMLIIAFLSGMSVQAWLQTKTQRAVYKEIKFSYYNPQAGRVEISGDFTGWETVKCEKRNDGSWEVIMKIKKNGRYRYLFIIDEETFVTDPAAKATVKDGFGRQNSVLTI